MLANINLKDFWQAQNAVKVLYGGRMSSKSTDAALQIVLILMSLNIRVLCARQFQKSIKDSIYSTIVYWIDRLKVKEQFEVTNRSIINKRTGSEAVFYGIARNLLDIKGLNDIGLTFIDESEGLTKEQFDVIEPTIMRSAGARLWIVFNPAYAADFIYQNFVANAPDSYLVRKINYDQNPFLSDTALATIDRMRVRNYDDYTHYYLAIPWTERADSIVKESWLRACIGAFDRLGIKQANVETRLGFDIGDSGDKSALVAAHGTEIFKSTHWQSKPDNLHSSVDKARELAKELNNCEIIFDSLGIGAFIGEYLSSLTYINYTKFAASGKVRKPKSTSSVGIKNEEYYENIKAQVWDNVATLARNTYNHVNGIAYSDAREMLSISANCEHIEEIILELTQPTWVTSQNGKRQVESKKDLLKRGIISPNLADAFVMSVADNIM